MINNIRSTALNSNILFGSSIFSKDVMYQVQKTDLPGISLTHIKEATKVGHINLQGDIAEYSPITMTILVDEKLVVWKELIGIMQKYHVPGTNTWVPLVGDSWIEFRDNRNNYMFKIELKNSYITSVGDLTYTTTGDNEILELQLELVYDFFEIA